MKNIFKFLLVIFLSLLFSNSISKSFEQEGYYQNYDNRPASSLVYRNPSTNSFSNNIFKLQLLGTIGSGGANSKAIIKNTETGKLKTYSEGEVIDLVINERIKIKKVFNCMVNLEIRGVYDTIECDNSNVSKTFRMPSPLARFKIIERQIKDKIKLKKFRAKYEEEILKACQKYRVDPYLVKAVIKVESNFNPEAVSPKKAMGIMQLIPATAKDYGVNDPFDPKDILVAGVRLIRDLLDYFKGNLELALSAYNAGRDAVIKYGYKIPPYPETEAYVEKVLAYYDNIKP